MAAQRIRQKFTKNGNHNKHKNDNNKNPVGRPTKYDPEFCDLIIEKARTEGLCKRYQYAELLGIRYETVWDWANKNPNFSNAIKVAQKAAEVWWLELAMKNLVMDTGTKFNNTPWIFIMKNIFKYRDVQEVTQTENKEVNLKVDFSGASIEDLKNLKEMTPAERRKKMKVA